MKIVFNNNTKPEQSIFESATLYRARTKKAWKKVGKIRLAPQAGFIINEPLRRKR